MARWVRSSGENVNLFRRVSTPDLLNDIALGDLWSDLSQSPPVVKKCTSLSPVTWASIETGGGGGGESNDAINIGTAGVGIYKQKTGVNIELKKINAGSSKITITDDTGNDEIDIDVAQANLDHGSIGGLADDDHTQYHNSTRADTWLATKSTTNLTEGTNLYYTTERAQDDIGAMIDSSLTYVDGTPLLQRAALTGDVTASAGSNSTTIASGVVTYAKIQNMATNRLLGRNTGGSGSVEEISVAGGIEFTGAGAIQTSAFTGDVTKTAGGTATTIAAGAVTLAQMANMATASVIYRKTAGTGAPEVNTLATLKTDLGLTGTNSGDQTSIGGITGTKAQFDTACTDGNFLYVGDISVSGTNTGDQNLFSTIAVSGQSNVVADATSDTLTLVAGSNITITTDAATDSITITGSGGDSGLSQQQVMAISSIGI